MFKHDPAGNPTAIAAEKNKDHTWPISPGASTGSPPRIKGDTVCVNLGGQAPMFIHPDIDDPGLIRIGGQSPLF